MKDISANLHVIRLEKREDVGNHIIYGPVKVLNATGAAFFLYSGRNISKTAVSLQESDDGVHWDIPLQEAIVMRPGGNGGHSRVVSYAGSSPYIQIELPFEMDVYIQLDSQFQPDNVIGLNAADSVEGNIPVAGGGSGADFSELEQAIEEIKATAETALSTSTDASKKATTAYNTAAGAQNVASAAQTTATKALETANDNSSRLLSIQDTANKANATASNAETLAKEANALAQVNDQKVEEAKRIAYAAQASAALAEVTASDALGQVNGLQMDVANTMSTAQAAQATAEEAKKTAEGLESKVQSAATEASEAKTAAEAAQTDAASALAGVNEAKAAATAAEASAADAITEAGNATTAANEAKDLAESLQANVNSTAELADEAKTAADTAIGIANGAREVADGLDGKINVANDNAANAVKAATEAQEAADAAKTEAEGKVSKTGDTMTGPLKIQSETYKNLILQAYWDGATPTDEYQGGPFTIFYDSQEKEIGSQGLERWANLVAFRCGCINKPVGATGEATRGEISVYYPYVGEPYGKAPTTPEGSNSNQIATADWVNKHKLDLSGGTLTGEIMRSFPFDCAQNPQSSLNIGAIGIKDSKNFTTNFFYGFMSSAGEVNTTMTVYSKKTDGSPTDGAYAFLRATRDNKTSFRISVNNFEPYSADVPTIQWSENRHPIKVTGNLNFYVGGANASDTADLFRGRGTSPEMPFATLEAAVNFVGKNYAGGNTENLQIKILIQGNIALTSGYSFNLYVPMLANLWMSSLNSSNLFTITLTKPLNVVDSNIQLSNINFQVAPENYESYWTAIQADGSKGSATILFRDKINFSGAAKCLVSAAWLGNIAVWNTENTVIGGTFTGKRYTCANGGRIITGGKGSDLFPGTVAGTVDSSSTYA